MNEITLKEIIETSQNMKFKYSGGTIEVNKDKIIYGTIVKKYDELAAIAMKMFVSRWYGYETVHELNKNYLENVIEFMVLLAKEIKNDLISVGIFSIDEKGLVNYMEQNGYMSLIVDFKTKFDDEFEAEESYDPNYRAPKQRNANSLGQALAMAAIDEIANNKKKVDKDYSYVYDLHKKDETIDELMKAIHNTVQNCHHIIIDLVNKNDVWRGSTAEEFHRAKGFLNNLDSNLISAEDKEKMANEIINLDPYNEEVYVSFIGKNIDDINVFLEMAGILGVNTNVCKVEAAKEYLLSIMGDTESEAWAARDLLKEYYKKLDLSYDADSFCVEYLEERICKFDEIYRTVDKFICSTREAADFAKEELVYITQFMDTVEKPFPDALLDYEVELLNHKTEFEEKFSSELRTKYIEQFDVYLKEFDEKFRTVNIFPCKTREEAGIKRAIKYTKKLDVSSEAAVAASKEELLQILNKFGITVDQAGEALKQIDKNRERLINPTASQKAMNKLSNFFS